MAAKNDTRNPLINDNPVETADSVKNVIAFLLETRPDSGAMTELADDGRRLILECVHQAVASLSETLQGKEAHHV